MLSLQKAQAVVDKLNSEARKAVAPHVMQRLHLSEPEFEAWARRFLEDSLVRTMERQDNVLSEEDAFMFTSYWRALWWTYRTQRAAGASMSGRA